MEIRNSSPFPSTQTVFMDKSATEQLVVTLKATYAISERGELAIAEEQDPLRLTDEFHGEPGKSSIKHQSELGPPGPATNALLVGCARTPRPGVRAVEVSFRVGPCQQRAIVVGNRQWSRGGASDPEPFDAIPLLWENGFGGRDETPERETDHASEPRNPVGRGFRARNSRQPNDGELLPNIENPHGPLRSLGQRVDPVGFGPIARDWQPRVGYAGTYDEQWMANRMPLLPMDFDDRFHNAAPPELVLPGYIAAGEWVQVVGCTAGGQLTFRLPPFQPYATVMVGGRIDEVDLACNSVTVDTDRMRLLLLWKGALRVHREVPRLKRTTISARRVA